MSGRERNQTLARVEARMTLTQQPFKGIDAKLAHTANVEGHASALLGQQVVADVVRAANLGAGDAQTYRIFVNGEEYILGIARPLTYDQAVAKRSRASGYLTLARGADDYPVSNGKTRFSVVCEDDTQEGRDAREAKSRSKDGQERGAEIRAAMREHGWSQEDAAHYVDKRCWRPGVSQPIPEGWTPPASRVAAPFKAQAGGTLTAAARWTAMRADWVSRLQGQVRAGSLTPVDATRLLRAWEDKHKAPAHTNAG